MQRLAQMEQTGETAMFTGLYRGGYEDDAQFETYRKSLKGLANSVLNMREILSHSLFLCAFWASVAERQGDNSFLELDVMPTCMNATVAWAKILMAHRTYYCNSKCESEEEDRERIYLWNFDIQWAVSNDWYTAGLSLALSYDVLYHRFTKGQQRLIRSAIALLVMNRWTWGTANVSSTRNPNAETDPHRIISNWGMYHSNLYLTNLAIEGESGFIPYASEILRQNNATGFNQHMDTKFDALIKAYMTHSMYPDGSTFEDGYTYHVALREGSLALVAAQRRGANVLTTPTFRNIVHNFAQQSEPWRCGPLVGHASGGSLGIPVINALFRYMYPEGPLSNMVWAQRMGRNFSSDGSCRVMWVQTMMQMVFLGDEHNDEAKQNKFADSFESLPEQFRSAISMGYVATRRGLIISRASFSQNASYMHFDARPDSYFLGHDNADRGTITFSALKRRWLDDLFWIEHLGSREHSLMHVDGLSQEKKAASVTILKVVNTDSSCIASADLTYTTNIQWAPAWQGPSVGTGTVKEYAQDGKSFKLNEYKFYDPEINSPWNLGWPMEDDSKEIGFNRSMTLNGISTLALSGINQWRRYYRKQLLRHLVRSTIIVRSQLNDVGFGILVDSVDAGDGMHTFESYLILHKDVGIDEKGSSCQGNTCKIILTSSGQERVDIHAFIKGQKLEFRKEVFEKNNKRIILKSKRETSEEFWVAFHPYNGSSNGFKMERQGDETVQFIYEGEKRMFQVNEHDKTVVEIQEKCFAKTHSSQELQKYSNERSRGANNGKEHMSTPENNNVPENNTVANDRSKSAQYTSSIDESFNSPMKPLPLSFLKWKKVTSKMLNADNSTFFHPTKATWQVVFNISSKKQGRLSDHFTTCQDFTKVKGEMHIYNCGYGEEGNMNYYERNCTFIAQSDNGDRCEGPNDGFKTDMKIILEGGEMYYVALSIRQQSSEIPQLELGHFHSWNE